MLGGLFEMVLISMHLNKKEVIQMKIYRRMRISLSELERLRDEMDDYIWIALDLKRSALCAGDEYSA